MSKRIAAVVVAIVCTLPLAGCIASQIPEFYEAGPIVVPESLKPTDVRGPLSSVDAACAASWPPLSEAISTYEGEAAKLHSTDIDFSDDFDRTDPLVQQFYANLSEITIARGEAILEIVEDINHTVVEDLLTRIAEGEIADGEFMATITDETTTSDQITAAEDKYLETLALMDEYAALCGVVIGGSSGA